MGNTATRHVVVSFRAAGRNLLPVHVPTALTPALILALTPLRRQQLLLTLPMPATSEGLPAKAIMDGCDSACLRACVLACLLACLLIINYYVRNAFWQSSCSDLMTALGFVRRQQRALVVLV